MDLQVTREGVSATTVVLHLAGRLNAAAAPELKQAIQDAAGTGVQAVIVDMCDVTFMDSSGMAALVHGFKTLRAKGGSFALSAVADQAETALRISRLNTVFPIYANVEAARLDLGGT